MTDKRFSRQAGLLKEGSQERLGKLEIAVIGAGANGGWLMPLLATMGCNEVTFYDDDKVSEANYSNQPYTNIDIGLSKVECLKRKYEESKFDGTNYTFEEERITKENRPKVEIIISAVDEIDVRSELFKEYRWDEDCKLWIDPRIGRHLASCFIVDLKNDEEPAYYEKHALFDKSEVTDIPCDEKTFIPASVYCSSVITSAIWAYANKELDKFPYKTYVDMRFHKYSVQRRDAVREAALCL